MVLQVVSVHRPCASSGGERTAWSQHKAHFNDQNDDWDPKKAFMEDLAAEIEEWIQEGDQVIVGGDLKQRDQRTSHQGVLCRPWNAQLDLLMWPSLQEDLSLTGKPRAYFKPKMLISLNVRHVNAASKLAPRIPLLPPPRIKSMLDPSRQES